MFNKKEEVEVETEEEAINPNDAIQAAFTDAIEAEKDEDEVKMAMIGEGATFKNVARLFNQFMIEAGLAISSADRKQLTDDALEGLTFDTEETFDAAVAALLEAIDNSTERSAAALVRSYAKRNEFEVYAKPKGESSTRNPFSNLFHAALIEDPTMTEDGLNAILDGLSPDHQVNPRRWFNQHNNIRKVVNSIAEKFTKAA